MEHYLPAAVAGAARVAVGTFNRGLFWGGTVHRGKGSPEGLLTRAWSWEYIPQVGRRAFLHRSALPVQSHTATEVDVFNFGICDGNLQGAVGALEAEREQAGAPRTGSEGKEVNKP